MEKLTNDEIKVIKKYYRLYGNIIPNDIDETFKFLDSISLHDYDRERHHDDKRLQDDISRIVDEHFIKNGRESNMTDDRINKRKDVLIDWIKSERHNSFGSQ